MPEHWRDIPGYEGVHRSSVHRSIRLGHTCCGFRFKFG